MICDKTYFIHMYFLVSYGAHYVHTHTHTHTHKCMCACVCGHSTDLFSLGSTPNFVSISSCQISIIITVPDEVQSTYFNFWPQWLYI